MISLLSLYLYSFTAWSSTREPAQVFTLLETVYKRFDVIASQRRVFKVETVGGTLHVCSPINMSKDMESEQKFLRLANVFAPDCYVAAAGIPDQRRDHVIVMLRFAHDILHAMST